MENRIWGDGIGNSPVRYWRFKAFVQCDAGSLWFVIIHKSKNLYGYGLAEYVVESSLGVPAGCAGKLLWQTVGVFGDAAMAEPWDGMGEVAMDEPIWHKRGLLGGCDAHTGGETSVGTLRAR
jgi:hypothetical protein